MRGRTIVGEVRWVGGGAGRCPRGREGGRPLEKVVQLAVQMNLDRIDHGGPTGSC